MSSWCSLFLAGMLIAALVISAGCTQQPDKTVKTGSNTGIITATTSGTTATQVPLTAAETVSTEESWKRVQLETSMGNITIALDPAMPVTAGNFETLVNKGFYNGVIFHRVINGFMIQGGGMTADLNGKPGGRATIVNEADNGLKNERIQHDGLSGCGDGNDAVSSRLDMLVKMPVRAEFFVTQFQAFGDRQREDFFEMLEQMRFQI